jgi:hypothetical protein
VGSAFIESNFYKDTLAPFVSTATKKGAVQFEPPPNGCGFQDAVVNCPTVANKG